MTARRSMPADARSTAKFEPGSKGIFATAGQGLNFRTRRRRSRPKTEAQKASLAEHVSLGGSISGWARENAANVGWASQLWSKIKRDLGWQAQ